ncbi:MAG: hypothetical protein Q8S84_08160 [bacterium]|nr:hypothetical protein [bacterium]MDP3381409.1 hypothetical protein [bacterium]
MSNDNTTFIVSLFFMSPIFSNFAIYSFLYSFILFNSSISTTIS